TRFGESSLSHRQPRIVRPSIWTLRVFSTPPATSPRTSQFRHRALSNVARMRRTTPSPAKRFCASLASAWGRWSVGSHRLMTGAGLTNPPIDDGVPPGLPLPLLALPVTVEVGGAPADVAYAGSVLGFVGLAQVNIRVPAVAASNAVPVQVAIGGNSRNQAVTI